MIRKGMQGPLARSSNSPPPPDFVYDPPTDPWLNVIHHDQELVVLSKPAGLLSVPGRDPAHHDSLELRARERFPEARIVHRLDRGTSGIFVMALTARAHRHLGLQFEKRQTRKTYVALVSGKIEKDKGTLDLAMRTDWYNRPKQMVDTCMGREAITQWEVLERHDNHTRVLLSPLTGRSHQLRVHMQYLGHPILGDSFYAPPSSVENSSRMMLHAESLEIAHPDGGQRVRFTDPCPF